MKKYLAYFGLMAKNQSAYKVDMAVDIASNMVFFFIFYALWYEIYTKSGTSEINTYSLSNTITYYFITSVIFRFIAWDSIYLNYDVWEGNFTNDIIKPWNARVVQFMATLGEIFVRFFIFLPFLGILILSAHRFITFPDPLHAGAFVITLFIGFFLIMAFMLIFHSLVFYYGDQEANLGLVTYLVMFLAGGIFPLVFLPEKTRAVFEIMPFKYLFDIPSNIFLNHFSTGEIGLIWLKMLLWTAIFYAIFLLVYKNGLKHYTGTGR